MRRVETLSVAHKQLVAIARALASEARLIIMDEPTTALTEREVRSLLGIIRRLKADGVAVLFVSHKLAEVLEVCEQVVVLRNGRKVAEGPASEFDAASLTRHMTGRDVPDAPPSALSGTPETLMRVQGLNKAGSFRDVTFDIRKGEVLGITGLLGSGRTSLAKALFGLVRARQRDHHGRRADVPLGDPLAAAACRDRLCARGPADRGAVPDPVDPRNVAIGRLDGARTARVPRLRKALCGRGGRTGCKRCQGQGPGRGGAGAVAVGRQPAARGAGPLARARARAFWS